MMMRDGQVSRVWIGVLFPNEKPLKQSGWPDGQPQFFCPSKQIHLIVAPP